MSDTDRPRVVAQYRGVVQPGTDSPLPIGKFEVKIVEGGTYRNLASRRKYTILDINAHQLTIHYAYTRNDGARVERSGRLDELGVVEAVGDSRGGLIQMGGDE